MIHFNIAIKVVLINNNCNYYGIGINIAPDCRSVHLIHLEVVLPREALVANRAPDALVPDAARRGGARAAATLTLLLLLLLHGLARRVSGALGFGCVDQGHGRVHLGGVRSRQVVAEDGGQLEDLPTDVAPAN